VDGAAEELSAHKRATTARFLPTALFGELQPGSPRREFPGIEPRNGEREGEEERGEEEDEEAAGGGEHFWQLGAFSLRYGRQSFIVVVELGVYARPEMPFFSISPWRETFIRVWFLVFSSFIS